MEPVTPVLPRNPTPSERTPGLSALELLEQLARQNNVEFSRPRARQVVSERLSAASLAGLSSDQRVARLLGVLAGIGLQGRVVRLTLSDAIAACAGGARLVTAMAATEEGAPAWLIIQAARRQKVRVASEHGPDLWISTSEAARLLGKDDSQATFSWLLAEKSLPCDPLQDEQAAAAPHRQAEDHAHEHHLSPLRRLVTILRPEAADIWSVIVFSAIVSMLAIATPVAVEALVNTVAFGSLLQPVVVLSLILFGFLGFAAAIRLLQTYVAEIIQRRIFVRVVADLSQRLPRVRHDALEGTHAPELLNRFFDVMTVQKSAALLVLDGIAIVLQTAVGMAVLAFYHPLLLGFDAFLLLALAFIVLVLGRGAVATSIEESKAKYDVAAWLETLAHCPLTFKNSGGAIRAVERADQLAIEYVRARQAHFRILLRQIGFTLGLQALAGSVLLGIGGWLVIRGQLTLGQLVAAELIVALIVGSFAKLGKHLEAYYDLLAGVDKLGYLFDLPIERNGGEPALATTQVPSVRLAGCELTAGELIALVGPPGCGKSQLLAAAFGIEQQSDHAPLIGRIKVSAFDLADLRTQVALVRQCEIFPGTILENANLGSVAGTRSAVRQCLEELGIGPVLDQLAAGLDTLLQPNGSPLTEGQARCVVLARALLSEPRVLLIDGLLDGLPDDTLPDVMEALQARASRMLIVIATGRREVAHHCARVIPLASALGRPTTPARLSLVDSHLPSQS